MSGLNKTFKKKIQALISAFSHLIVVAIRWRRVFYSLMISCSESSVRDTTFPFTISSITTVLLWVLITGGGCSAGSETKYFKSVETKSTKY